MQRQATFNFTRLAKQRLSTLTQQQRSVHNSSNPHQSKQQQQLPTHHQQAQNAHLTEEPTPLTNMISNSQDLIKYTHSHIRTQRLSPTDRMVTQLNQFDQLYAATKFPSYIQKQVQQVQQQQYATYRAAIMEEPTHFIQAAQNMTRKKKNVTL